MGRGPLSSARGTGSERQVGGAAGAEGSGGKEICFLGCWMCEVKGNGREGQNWESHSLPGKALKIGTRA